LPRFNKQASTCRTARAGEITNLPRIGILSPSLTTADAVSNDVLGMYDVLRRQGNNVRLFSETRSLGNHQVFDVSGIKRFLKGADDILIYHYSVGWSPVLSLLRDLKCRKAIKYHNVTPAKFFMGFSISDQRLCEDGREQLRHLAQSQCDLYLADSTFNKNELLAEGASDSRSFVVPPFHHIDRLAAIAADEAVLGKYSDGTANILTVGRVMPNKGHLTLIEVFAGYYYNCNRNSRLIIVGKGGEGSSPYSKLLHKAVDSVGLKDAVVFSGGVSDEALKSYYLVADAFVMASEHEGFCVPLVEAMSMKLPITAFASTAIPETLGEAGLAWPERDPFLIAESIDLILRDNSVRAALALRGRQRYETKFTNQIIESSFLHALSCLQ
jgi:glycosyltransferase involved in cell wall biosynthesis